jgi:hypothetical protein
MSENFFSRSVARLQSLTRSALGIQHSAFSIPARDDPRDRQWSSGGTYPRDRYTYNREEILRDILVAWRDNPLLRRIVALNTDFIVGSSITVESPDPHVAKFLHAWWNDDLNHMPTRIFEWSDEITRSGELFPVLSTDAAGMTYIRAYPASEITEIHHKPNDVEQETGYTQKPEDASLEERTWTAYDHRTDTRNPDGTFTDVMLHFAINRPVGATRGESDLAPIVRWINRYSAWLEDRVRLNRFRQSFLYVVYGKFKDAAQRIARQAELNANPPSPGSILVADMDQEKWDVIHPKLDSFEAERDGLTIKKLIASGAGLPIHFLAEPESSTRTTAEQADDPTHRHFDRRQFFFGEFLVRIARIALRRRAMVDRTLDPNAEITIKLPDIFERDNSDLATAAEKIINAFAKLHDRGLIDDAELVRLAYRFAGELVDVQDILANARKQKNEAPANAPAGTATPQS